MTIRLYMDQDSLTRAVVLGIRAKGIDVLTAEEALMKRATDEEQLAFAHEEGRVVVSANGADFARLHGRWMRDGRAHSGIVVRSDQRLSVSAQLAGLAAICERYKDAGCENLILYLENWM